ncbi:hypothetical protein HDV00_011697 [Rhizophlyctis rosea]|nr:hypothetical protein HDV00_011697 [Rhizophlyctis rosea]
MSPNTDDVNRLLGRALVFVTCNICIKTAQDGGAATYDAGDLHANTQDLLDTAAVEMTTVHTTQPPHITMTATQPHAVNAHNTANKGGVVYAVQQPTTTAVIDATTIHILAQQMASTPDTDLTAQTAAKPILTTTPLTKAELPPPKLAVSATQFRREVHNLHAQKFALPGQNMEKGKTMTARKAFGSLISMSRGWMMTEEEVGRVMAAGGMSGPLGFIGGGKETATRIETTLRSMVQEAESGQAGETGGGSGESDGEDVWEPPKGHYVYGKNPMTKRRRLWPRGEKPSEGTDENQGDLRSWSDSPRRTQAANRREQPMGPRHPPPLELELEGLGGVITTRDQATGEGILVPQKIVELSEEEGEDGQGAAGEEELESEEEEESDHEGDPEWEKDELREWRKIVGPKQSRDRAFVEGAGGIEGYHCL